MCIMNNMSSVFHPTTNKGCSLLKFIFFNLCSNQKEMWTFIDNLFMHIPFSIEIDKLKEIFDNCGWCKKVE